MQLHTQKQLKYFDEVIRLHVEEGLGEDSIAMRIPLGHTTIGRKIANFASENKEQDMPQKQTETKPMAKDAQARIAELEAKLRKAELARDAYDEMINVAEAKFNIPIRKKAGAKQAYYKYDEQRALMRAASRSFAIEYAKGIRVDDPSMGITKIWDMYRKEFRFEEEILGRDAFEDLLVEAGMKVRLKMRKPRTTDSSHGLPTFPNIAKKKGSDIVKKGVKVLLDILK